MFLHVCSSNIAALEKCVCYMLYITCVGFLVHSCCSARETMWPMLWQEGEEEVEEEEGEEGEGGEEEEVEGGGDTDTIAAEAVGQLLEPEDYPTAPQQMSWLISLKTMM